MNIEAIHDYCMQKPGTTDEFPFDEKTLVFKVMGKMFLLTGLEYEDVRINVKCDPEYAIELRENYGDIIGGYHMSKKHWNTVYTERELKDSFVKELIDHSYDLVVSKFTLKLKEELRLLSEQM